MESAGKNGFAGNQNLFVCLWQNGKRPLSIAVRFQSFFYPKTTSSTIISANPAEKNILLRCRLPSKCAFQRLKNQVPKKQRPPRCQQDLLDLA